MKSISTIQKLLIRAAGYDLESTKSCTTSEVNKMAKHGTLVIIPAIVGLFSMSYAMQLITQNNQLAILGGVVWGVLIFFIDRSLVGLIRPGSFNVGILGRFLFAIIIGFTVAEPVVLLTFKDAIKEKINSNYISKKDNVNSKYEPRISFLDAKLKIAKERLETKQKLYTQEMDGTGGSGNPNKGPIFKQKYEDYQNELLAYNALKSEITSQISEIKTKRDSDISNVKEFQANGLLGQFRALHAIEDKEVTYATWVLRLFFFFIEILPFLIKISPNDGTDLYYDLVENYNQVQLDIVTSNNTKRKELMESEERLLNKERILKLNELETKKIAISNDINAEYITKQMYNAVDKKLKQDLKIIKNINDEEAREKLLKQINSVFDGYFDNMEKLIVKSNQFYSNNL